MRKQKSWNILAIVAVVLAMILALLAISRIDVVQVRSRDNLRLASSARALNTDPAQLPPSGWSTLRGTLLSDDETCTDLEELDSATHHVRVGIYANTTSELELGIPSLSGEGGNQVSSCQARFKIKSDWEKDHFSS